MSNKSQQVALAWVSRNLVVVLDYSGSMSSSFDEYYYDRFGNLVRSKEEGSEHKKTKMQIADESVVALLDHLEPEDSFGLVIYFIVFASLVFFVMRLVGVPKGS